MHNNIEINEPEKMIEHRKLDVIMNTNITPKQKQRVFKIYPDAPLNKFIELYEQVFDIDLYAYRVSFQEGGKVITKLN